MANGVAEWVRRSTGIGPSPELSRSGFSLRAERVHTVEPLRVKVAESSQPLQTFAAEIRELNRAGRRPSLFQTPEFLSAHVAFDEFAAPETCPRIVLVFEGQVLIGLLLLRRRSEQIFGLRRERLEFLVPHDTERPTVIARAEDERRVAIACFDFLVEHEPGWTMLELVEQDSASALYDPPPSVDARRFYARRFPNNPNATIDLEGGFESWFRGLRNARANLTRRTRVLVEAGRVEFVVSGDRAAATRLLDLYLDLEARSWKRDARAGISRHPVRIELFRALLDPGQPANPVFHFLLLDGLPIAGMLSLLFADVAYQMELAFDSEFSALSPGNVLFMLGVQDLVDRGAKAYNLLGNFAYHKARWGAVVTPTEAVQIYRRGSLHLSKARVGELWRRARPPVVQNAVDYNLSKPRDSVSAAGSDPERRASRELSGSVLAELEQGARSVHVRTADEWSARLPFPVDRR